MTCCVMSQLENGIIPPLEKGDKGGFKDFLTGLPDYLTHFHQYALRRQWIPAAVYPSEGWDWNDI